jgi:nicotinate-nucleotide--dimethylbenzimidazole phosphoribosyltransferase
LNTNLSIDATVAAIPNVSSPELAKSIQGRWDSLTKPRGSLGVLEGTVVKLGCIQNTAMPSIDRRAIFLFCGDHGITEEGVSAYPSVVTREMVRNFLHGGAAINVLSRRIGAVTQIIDAGVAGPKIEGVIDRRVAAGTKNFARIPAMSREQAETALRHGIELASEAAREFDIVAVGEMGIGNTTSASALLCALTGATPNEAVGRGAGLDDAGLERKRKVVAAALALHRVDPRDPFSAVTAFAGFEIAMMAGFILGAAQGRLPVVIDGFIGGAAFLIARSFYPSTGLHAFWGHRSAEPGHAKLLREAGGEPLLDLSMRLGEGTGAALAMQVLISAVELYRDMATFTEASVSDKQGSGIPE